MQRNHAAYETDFVAWADEQAALLRAGAVGDLDLEHLAEEIADMGGQIRRELRNRLVQLILHLLKWRYQPTHRSLSWFLSIRNQRYEIGDLVADNPSLASQLLDTLTKAYLKARADAAVETGLPLKTFPAQPPFTLEEILDPRFPADLGGPEED